MIAETRGKTFLRCASANIFRTFGACSSNSRPTLGLRHWAAILRRSAAERRLLTIRVSGGLEAIPMGHGKLATYEIGASSTKRRKSATSTESAPVGLSRPRVPSSPRPGMVIWPIGHDDYPAFVTKEIPLGSLTRGSCFVTVSTVFKYLWPS